MNILFLIYFSIIYFFQTVVCLIAYDFQHDLTSFTTLFLVDVPNCVLENRTIEKIEKEIQLIQPREYQEIETINCLIEAHHIVMRIHIKNLKQKLEETKVTTCRISRDPFILEESF